MGPGGAGPASVRARAGPGQGLMGPWRTLLVVSDPTAMSTAAGTENRNWSQQNGGSLLLGMRRFLSLGVGWHLDSPSR